MAHISLPSVTVDKTKLNKEVPEIERFRAHHRCIHRGHQSTVRGNRNAESLDVEGGRTRKVSAKWRQRQHQAGFDDGIWPVSAGTEMRVGFNAFDFSACPEAFDEEEQPAGCILQSYPNVDQLNAETEAKPHNTVSTSEPKHRVYKTHGPPAYHGHYGQLHRSVYCPQHGIA